MPSIVHLTTAHPRHDTRIFYKECTSLAKQPGWRISLIVADGQGDAVNNNVHIYDVGKPTGRLNRMFSSTRRVLAKATIIDAECYHLHDPELISVGLQLLHRKKKVIFDSHEDVPRQILNKPYLNQILAKIISTSFACYESSALRCFDGIIGATLTIADTFFNINKNVVVIKNYPLLGEFANSIACQQMQDRPYVCYIGDLTRIRGIQEIVQATAYLKSTIRLQLGGCFSESDFERQVRSLPSWKNVDYHGFLPRDGVREILGQASAGLVTLHPVRNYLDALPVKMFEYMAAGIPVIASNFPLWREIVQSAQCGLCVDPLDPKAIAQAIDFLHDHPEEARRMGENGRRAVLEKYNWAIEEQKLVAFYHKLLQDGR